ncbi:MAG: amidase family protein [Minisyncoccales bacterium]
MTSLAKIRDIACDFRSGKSTVQDLIKPLIGKSDGRLNFDLMDKNTLLKEAQETQEKILLGDERLFLGIPSVVSDNIMINGFKTEAGSKILDGYRSPYDATIVKKLKKEGTIVLGKTKVDEFGIGLSFDSAKIILDGLASFVIDLDSAGSLRRAASYHNLVGFKPSRGSVSRYGVVSADSSFSQAGIIAGNVEDVEDVLKVISGKDGNDLKSEDPNFSKEEIDFSKIKIGLPRSWFDRIEDKIIQIKTKEAAESLSVLGIKIEEISFVEIDHLMPTYYVLSSSEISSNMGRYDGLRYGLSSAKGGDLTDDYVSSRGEGFSLDLKERIIFGAYALLAGNKDNYYQKAVATRSFITGELDKSFNKVDLILTPTTPNLLPEGDQSSSSIFNVIANLSGIPSISIPYKKEDENSIGIQIMAPCSKENLMIKFGKKMQELWKI